MMLRLSFRMSVLIAVLVLSSCSKKDVVQDESAISPGAQGSDSVGSQAMGGGEGGAGEAGVGAQDLKGIYFDFDSYALSSQSRTTLKESAKWLRSNKSIRVQVEGHCDERGTTEYNLALGEKRARAAQDYLVKLGVPKGRVDVISYGEEKPIDPGHDEGAWAKNRRAEFVILPR